jgi:hypothetical protein
LSFRAFFFSLLKGRGAKLAKSMPRRGGVRARRIFAIFTRVSRIRAGHHVFLGESPAKRRAECFFISTICRMDNASRPIATAKKAINHVP